MNQNRVSTRYTFLKILTGSDLSRRRLPLMVIESKEPGPIVWLTACIHGDEVGGQLVIQEVFKLLKSRLIRGAVYAFPLMNPIGFENSTRTITFSREDLNRSFPGNPNGSLGERMAYLIFQKIKDTQPQLLLDLHNDWRQSVPYVLLDKASQAISGEAYNQARLLGQKSGFYLVEDTDEIHNSLSHCLLQHAIPAITYELGESSLVNEKTTAFGASSVINLLAQLKMVDSNTPQFDYLLHPSYRSDQILRYSDKPYCTKSGIIRFIVKPGTSVRSGQALAKIFNAFGKLQENLVAETDAIILGTADSAVAFPGMSPTVSGIV